MGWWWAGGLQHFSVSPRPLVFGFGTKGLGAKGLGPGLDKNDRTALLGMVQWGATCPVRTQERLETSAARLTTGAKIGVRSDSVALRQWQR